MEKLKQIFVLFKDKYIYKINWKRNYTYNFTLCSFI